MNKPYIFRCIEQLAITMQRRLHPRPGFPSVSDSLHEIAEIVEIAEKVVRDECGYTKEDLIEAINTFKENSCS